MTKEEDAMNAIYAQQFYTQMVLHEEEQRSRNRKIFDNSLHLLLLRPFNFNNQSGEDVKYAETTFQV